MARLATLSLLSLTIVSYTYTTQAQNFIEMSCRKTRYPPECIQNLTPEAPVVSQSPLKLAQIALSKNLKKSEDLNKFLTEETSKPGIGPKEQTALKDCLEGMTDILEQLTQSVKEIDTMGGPGDFELKKSNVQTWVSAVLTDYSTCVDGFADTAADPKVTDPIKVRVNELDHDTTNALALINELQGPA